MLNMLREYGIIKWSIQSIKGMEDQKKMVVKLDIQLYQRSLQLPVKSDCHSRFKKDQIYVAYEKHTLNIKIRKD